MENRQTPEVRIEGFSGKLKQSNLNSLVDRVKSYSLSRDVETSEYTGYKYIHYGDIHTKVANIIDRFSNLPNIKTGNYELLKKGDLVLADASEDYQGIATPAVITIDVPYKLVSGLHTIALRPKSVNSLFLYYMIHSPVLRKYGYKTGTGMKVFGISVTNLLKFEGKFPTLLEEQQKIGSFFKQLDDTIALQQQELDTLKQTKQGFLQKMFPKEGETVPEVRFLGFSGEWEPRKLGEVIDGMYNGQTPSRENKENWNGDINWLTSGELNRGTVTETIEKITSEGQKDALLKFVPAGTFVMAITGLEAAGTRGNCAKLAIDTTINQSCMAIYPNTNLLDSKFLFQWYRKFGEEYGLRYTQGTKQQSYNAELIKILPITLPKIDEQKKIAIFLDDIDKTIALHQRELDALKETKKAFLQKMFI